MCVGDLETRVTQLRERFLFREVARRRGEVVLRQGGVTLLLSQRGEEGGQEAYPWLAGLCTVRVDSVFNLCLEVGDVAGLSEAMVTAGSRLLLPPSSLVSEDGEVEVAVVSSPCDNVIHSLVNTSRYSGVFLPGFPSVEQEEGREGEELLTHIDHVTYVCEEGASARILDFYGQTCGMRRFLVAPGEDPVRGLELEGGPGLRLLAGEWLAEWLCREEGLQWSREGEGDNFKLVLAEPLPCSPHSHVNTFLQDHGGPGVQHLGLTAAGPLAPTILRLRGAGHVFRSPPPTYYRLEDKQRQIRAIGQDPEIFRELGILIDPEPGQEEDQELTDYILQIFTLPLFSENTFFLEVIQRSGACRGFGAGNIRALAESIVMLEREGEGGEDGAAEDTLEEEEQKPNGGTPPEGLSSCS